MSETLERLRSDLAPRYVIERELGHGGMATVYVAFDKRHDRRVAIKVFPPALAQAIGPERFQREIAITARLSHPHILPLYDSGQAAGALYYVMPLVKGESLRARLDRNSDGLPVSETISLAGQVAEALDHAHGKGVIHRDVTPDNVLLSDDHALLADFGIARLVEGETLTESGLPLGTAMYRSPEQAAGHSRVDAASDIYSLGCVLYECLGGSAARPRLSNRFAAPVPPLRKLKASIPVAVDAAIARAMTTDSAQRFASAGDFARALARPLPIRDRWRRIRPAAAMVLFLALVAAGFSVFRGHEPALNRTRVLVGQFVNRTGDKSLDALGEMTGDYIARGLAETRLLEVIDSRTEKTGSRRSGTLSQAETRAMAASVGAATTVQGSFYRTGDRLHFETQIVDTRSGKLVASTPPADGAVADRTALIENLRQHLMGSFAALFGPDFEAWQAASLPPTYEAYEEMLAGDVAVWQLDNFTAITHYRRASEMDTSYPGAKTKLALAASLAGQCGTADSIAAALASRRSSLSALDVGRLDWGQTRCHGEWERSLEAGRRVMAAATKSVSFSVLLAVTAIELFRPREAIDVLGKVSPEQMQFTAAQRSIRTDFLALAWHELGDHQKELDAIRHGQQALPDDPHLKSDELVALATLGRVSEMRKLRDDWQNGSSHFDRQLWNPAQVDLCIGTELRAHGRPTEGAAAISEASAWFRSHNTTDGSMPTDVLCAFRLLVPTYYAGKFDEARAFYEKVLSRDPANLQAHEGLGAIAARRHDLVEMNRIDSWLASHPSEERARTTYSRARMATLAGQADRGMSLLTQAMHEGLGYTFLVHVDPDLETLRAKPDYRRLFALKD